MRIALAACGILPATASSLYAQSQTPAKPPAPAAALRYFTLYSDTLGELSSDGFLKETLQGTRVTAAELDVCYNVAANSSRKDRFVIALKPDGARLTGTGQSSDGKQAVSVTLTRSAEGDAYRFVGSITLGGNQIAVDVADLASQTEEQFNENLPADPPIVQAPAAFGDISPTTIVVKVARADAAGLLQMLRGENVRVAFSSLVDTCAALRTGAQFLQFDVATDRAAALVAKLRGQRGVADAGWTASAAVDWAIRFPAASWRGGAGLDRDKIAARLAETAGRVIGASEHAIAWDQTTGELKLTFKRRSAVVPSLALTDKIEMTFLLAPETLQGATNAVLWLEAAHGNTVDEGSGPRLSLLGADDSESEGTARVDADAVLGAIVTAFGGQRWNTEAGSWQ